MLPMDEETDDPEMQAKLIAELEQLARGGQAREMAGRLGKLPPEEPMPAPEDGAPTDMESLDAAAEEPIPGVEDEEGAEGGTGQLDQSKLRALLASMKSKPIG